MTSSTEENELLIDEYVDGRLAGSRRELFETRLRKDAEFRRKVETATQSLQMLQQVLKHVKPSEAFEEKVTSQIVSITQSNQNLHPAAQIRHGGKLTAADPDAKLLHDPEAAREKRRLMLLAAVAAVLFAAAVACMALAFIRQSGDNAHPPAAPARTR